MERDDDAIRRALDHVHEAQRKLSHAQEDELAAGRELINAEEELEHAEQAEHASGGRKEVTVKVKHLGEHERASFEVEPAVTLQALWDEAYRELEIDRKEGDVLQAPHGPNPVSLVGHLGLTLAEARRQNLCDLSFEIAAATGGA